MLKYKRNIFDQTIYIFVLDMLLGLLAQFHTSGLIYCIIVVVFFQMQSCFFAIHIFSAGSMLKDSECERYFLYYINVEFIEEFNTENLSKPLTCSVRFEKYLTVYDCTGLYSSQQSPIGSSLLCKLILDL